MSPTSSSTRRCALRAWSSSSCTSSSPSFERCRRVIRIIRPCAGKSGFPSSLRLAQPRRHLVPDYFVYSSNSRRWHLLPRLLLRLRPPWRPSLLVPLGDGVWLCILPCTSGIGNTGACPSSPMRSRAWQTRACVARWPDYIDFGIAPSTTASTRRHLRLRRLLHYATTMAPPRAPAASCAATSSSATSTALRRPRLLYARHLRPWLLQLGYLDISTKGYHPHEFLAGSLQSQHPHCADATTAGGMSVRRFLPSASPPVSPSAVLPL